MLEPYSSYPVKLVSRSVTVTRTRKIRLTWLIAAIAFSIGCTGALTPITGDNGLISANSQPSKDQTPDSLAANSATNMVVAANTAPASNSLENIVAAAPASPAVTPPSKRPRPSPTHYHWI